MNAFFSKGLSSLFLLGAVTSLTACGGGSSSDSSGGSTGEGASSELKFHPKFPYSSLNQIRYNAVSTGESITFNYDELLRSSHGHPSTHIAVNQAGVEKKYTITEFFNAAPASVDVLRYDFKNVPNFEGDISLVFKDKIAFYQNNQRLNETIAFNDIPVDYRYAGVSFYSPALFNRGLKEEAGKIDGYALNIDPNKDFYLARASGSSTLIETGTWQDDSYSPKRKFSVIRMEMRIDNSKFYNVAERVLAEFTSTSPLANRWAGYAQDMPKYIDVDIKMKLVDGLGAVEREYKFSSSTDANQDGLDDVFYNEGFYGYRYTQADTDSDHWLDGTDRAPLDSSRH